MDKRQALLLWFALPCAVCLATRQGKGEEPVSAELDLQDEFKLLTSDPDVYNDLLGKLQKDNRWAFLEKLNLKFKTFDSQETGEYGNLGVEFDFDYPFTTHSLYLRGHEAGFSVGFSAEGNIAFDQDVNPSDFLKADLKFELFSYHTGQEVGAELSADRKKELKDLKKGMARKLAESGASFDQIRKSEEWKRYLELEKEGFETDRRQLFWNLSGHAAVESNQDFSSKQYAYGVAFGLVGKSHRDSDGWYNILDYPAALLRVLTGTDTRLQPSGRAFPSVLIGVDLVDPKDNEARLAADPDDAPFTRFKAEIAYKSVIAQCRGEKVYLGLSYRYFKEFSASGAVEAAGLEEHSYLAVCLDLPGGFYVSYADGKLPLDQKDDQIFELGVNLNF